MKNILIILFLSFNSIHSQELDRTKKPLPQPTPKLSIPIPQRGELNNGLKIMLVEHHEMPVVQVQLIFQSGSSNDPSTKAGVAVLTAQMLDEGTKKRSALQISDDVEYLGSNLNISSSQDASFASLLTLKDELENSFEIFADVILNPTFPSTEWDRIKKSHLTSLLQRNDQPGQIASLVYSKVLFGDSHPYGKPTTGTEESVKQIEVADLVKFYNSFYSPNNATVIVVGDITLSEAKKLLNKYFGSWKKQEIAEPTYSTSPTIVENKIYLIDKPQAAQSEIRVGHMGVARSNSDYYAITVLNSLLGGQFSSRINMNLRESKGYTYGAGSSFSMRKEVGPFTVSGAFRSNVTDSSIIEIITELKNVTMTNVTGKELEQAKNSIIRSQPVDFETPQQIAGQLMNLVLYNLPDDYYNTSIQNFENLTITDIRNAANKYIHPSKMNIVLVGDMSTVLTGLEKIGSVSILDNNGNKVNGKK